MQQYRILRVHHAVRSQLYMAKITRRMHTTVTVLERASTDGTETSDNSTLSTQVFHCTRRSLPHSVLFVRVSHSLTTGNAAFDTALPVIFIMPPHPVTDWNFSSLTCKGLKLTANDQSLLITY
jgi:hypothetical protein